MAWVYLIVAGMFETVWAVGMKYSEGFTKLYPSLLVAVAMFLSVWLLGLAMRSLPLGTAYAVWTGIGTLGAVIYGIFFFGESADVLRLIFVAMILGGLIGLKAVSA